MFDNIWLVKKGLKDGKYNNAYFVYFVLEWRKSIRGLNLWMWEKFIHGDRNVYLREWVTKVLACGEQMQDEERLSEYCKICIIFSLYCFRSYM